jgi:hypothetical protein
MWCSLTFAVDRGAATDAGLRVAGFPGSHSCQLMPALDVAVPRSRYRPGLAPRMRARMTGASSGGIW